MLSILWSFFGDSPRDVLAAIGNFFHAYTFCIYGNIVQCMLLLTDYEGSPIYAAFNDTSTGSTFDAEEVDALNTTCVLTGRLKSKNLRINHIPEVCQVPEGNSR